MNLKKLLTSCYQALLIQDPVFRGCHTCGVCPPPLIARRPRVPVTFPIDIVYTWVDGADPQLFAKKHPYLPLAKQQTESSQGTALFRDNDELRYSLRSVHEYAPWVRRIFIITDTKTPAWLNTAHPAVTIVDHQEFIPPKFLPAFNSHVIEAHLHRIPNLNEHYIYFNDDFFLSAPSEPEDFFTPNGLPHIFLDWTKKRRQGYMKAATPHADSHHIVRAWLAAHGVDPAPEIITTHMPYPQSITNAENAYAFYREAIEKFCHNKFRSFGEMAFPCHAVSLLSYAQKTAVPCDTPYIYINIKKFDRMAYYDYMTDQKDAGTLPLFFCLNDATGTPPTENWQQDMHNFLRSFSPTPSPFEKLPLLYSPLTK